MAEAWRKRERPDAHSLSRRYRMAPLVVADREALREGTWSLELAWDGHRVLVTRVADRTRIVSADFREWSDAFPTITLALRRLEAREAVFEGFLCALDDHGRPSFELLRERARTRKGAVLIVWDVLHIDGEDLRTKPLAERRRALVLLVATCGAAVTVSEPLEGHPDAVLAAMQSNGVPGVFARREDAPYPTPDEKTWLAVASGEAPVAWSRSLSPAPVVTNEKKVLYPRDGFTKSDVVAYYADVAEVMLPLLRDRPIVAQRWPDGIDEFTWYQHRIPPKAPDYVRGVWIEGNHRIVLSTKDALLWMVNQAAITIHGWSSRTNALSEPDWVIIDLDPGESTTWADVIEVATALRKLLELLELPSVPKTSGQRGLHVLIPIAAKCSPARAHELARGIAVMIGRLLPDKVTLESAIDKRGGRLFVDHLQNFAGKTLVLPYSLRAADGAPVSTPLAWNEVNGSLDPRSFNVRTMRARLDRHGDLAAPLFDRVASVEPAIAKLTSA